MSNVIELLKENIRNRASMYQSELEAIRRGRPDPVIREKEGYSCAFETVFEVNLREIELEAQLKLLSALYSEIEMYETFPG